MPVDISSVKAFIEEGYRDLQTVEDIASRFEVSSETLRKEFHRKVRVPLSRYIVLVKVEKMKEMLLRTEKRCFEICFDVGFKREDTGAKIFKRVTGETMLEYRRCDGGDAAKHTRCGQPTVSTSQTNR